MAALGLGGITMPFAVLSRVPYTAGTVVHGLTIRIRDTQRRTTPAETLRTGVGTMFLRRTLTPSLTQPTVQPSRRSAQQRIARCPRARKAAPTTLPS